MKSTFIYTYLLYSIFIINQTYAWTLFKLTNYTDAKCLDGSSPGYYYKPATSKQSEKNFIIKFYSYGYCGHEAMSQEFIYNCYTRMNSDKGSSNFFNYQPYDLSGIFSPYQGVNPQYYDWNMLVFHSCDGTLMQGYIKEPVMYKNAKLWFRGYNNTESSILEVYNKYKLEDANYVVIQGCSAGGLAAAQWLNYIRNLLPKKVKMYAVLDAAFLLDIKNIITKTNYFREYIIQLMHLVYNETNPVVDECNHDYPQEKWRCIFLQYLQQYIKIPIFITQSLNDFWQFQHIFGQYCENMYNQYSQCVGSCSNKGLDTIDQFLNEYQLQLQKTIDTDPNNRELWTSSCMGHCLTIDDRFFANENYAFYSTNKSTIARALQKWSEKLIFNQN